MNALQQSCVNFIVAVLSWSDMPAVYDSPMAQRMAQWWFTLAVTAPVQIIEDGEMQVNDQYLEDVKARIDLN